jgi:hypothetical protein
MDQDQQADVLPDRLARLWAAARPDVLPHAVEPGALGEYAELVHRVGHEAAAQDFPDVTAHLKSECKTCAQDLDDLLHLLKGIQRLRLPPEDMASPDHFAEARRAADLAADLAARRAPADRPEEIDPAIEPSGSRGEIQRLEQLVEVLKHTNAVLLEELAARRREVQQLHALLEQAQARALPSPSQGRDPGQR